MSLRFESHVSDTIELVAVGRPTPDEPMHIGEVVPALVFDDGRTVLISMDELERGIVPERLREVVGLAAEPRALAVWASACGIAFDDPPETQLLTLGECEVALEAGDLCADCDAGRLDPQADTRIIGLPTEEELLRPDTPWQVVVAPGGRYRIVFRSQPDPTHWWLLDRRTVISDGDGAILGGLPADAGVGVLVVPRLGGRPGHTVAGDLALSRAGVSDPVEQEVRLVSAGAARTVAVLPDWLSLLSFDQQHGRHLLAQLSWSPHKGLRPDLERQLQVWDLTGEVPPWTAQPRFQADEARIDTEAGTVTLKSKRYGTTVLGLTDGHLVSDRLGRSGLRAREPRYPGVAGD